MSKKEAEAVDDREAETETGGVLLFGCRQPAELTKNIVLLVLGNADSAVPDFDLQHARTTATTNHDPASLSIADGIRGQIEQNALEQNEVAADPGTARDDPQT